MINTQRARAALNRLIAAADDTAVDQAFLDRFLRRAPTYANACEACGKQVATTTILGHGYCAHCGNVALEVIEARRARRKETA